MYLRSKAGFLYDLEDEIVEMTSLSDLERMSTLLRFEDETETTSATPKRNVPAFFLYYSSGCGHCIKYVKTYRALAGLVREKKRPVMLVGVNCYVLREVCRAALPSYAVPQLHFIDGNGTITIVDRKKMREVDYLFSFTSSLARGEEDTLKRRGEILRYFSTRNANGTAAGSKAKVGYKANVSRVVETEFTHEHRRVDVLTTILLNFYQAAYPSVKMSSVRQQHLLQIARTVERIWLKIDAEMTRQTVSVVVDLLERLKTDKNDKGLAKDEYFLNFENVIDYYTTKQRGNKFPVCSETSKLMNTSDVCGFWMYLHFLSMHVSSVPESIRLIESSVDLFLDCDECKFHFLKAWRGLIANYKLRSREDVIFELFALHDSVTRRVARENGFELAEVIWPDPAQCAACYVSEKADFPFQVNRVGVLAFLQETYAGEVVKGATGFTMDLWWSSWPVAGRLVFVVFAVLVLVRVRKLGVSRMRSSKSV